MLSASDNNTLSNKFSVSRSVLLDLMEDLLDSDNWYASVSMVIGNYIVTLLKLGNNKENASGSTGTVIKKLRYKS